MLAKECPRSGCSARRRQLTWRRCALRASPQQRTSGRRGPGCVPPLSDASDSHLHTRCGTGRGTGTSTQGCADAQPASSPPAVPPPSPFTGSAGTAVPAPRHASAANSPAEFLDRLCTPALGGGAAAAPIRRGVCCPRGLSTSGGGHCSSQRRDTEHMENCGAGTCWTPLEARGCIDYKA